MNGNINESFEEHKDMYVINLDISRIFWLIAIGLFSVTFFFLFGYWLGNDTADSKTTNYKPFINMNRHENPNYRNQISETGSTLNTSGNGLEHKNLNRQELKAELQNRINQRDRETNTETTTNRASINLNLDDNSQSHNANKPYTIQVSIHKVKSNAQKLMEKLNRKGFNAYIHTKYSSKGYELSFVRVGPFASEGEAQRTQHRLRTKVREARNCLVVKK